jgi:hypothetical protein
LPHPEMHRRAFVLVPLLDVDPHWRHPVLAVGGSTLLARLTRVNRQGVRQSLDFACSACDKTDNEAAPRGVPPGAIVLAPFHHPRGTIAWRA